jgi:hypothetical protein
VLAERDNNKMSSRQALESGDINVDRPRDVDLEKGPIRTIVAKHALVIRFGFSARELDADHGHCTVEMGCSTSMGRGVEIVVEIDAYVSMPNVAMWGMGNGKVGVLGKASRGEKAVNRMAFLLVERSGSTVEDWPGCEEQHSPVPLPGESNLVRNVFEI